MKLAHIPPTKLLYLVENEPFHLILAQECEKSREYANFFRRLSDNGAYIILDNGAFESGAAIDIDVLKHWIDYIRPKEVVLPDVLRDPQQTLQRTDMALTALMKYVGMVKFMAVPQGRTLAAWLSCLETLLKWSEIDVIGIYEEAADFFTTGAQVGRGTLLGFLSDARYPHTTPREWHLLGYDSHLVELSYVPSKYSWVRSADSAKVIVFGMNHIRLASDLRCTPKYPGRPKPYFDWNGEVTATMPDIIRHNMRVANFVAEGGVSA